MRRMLGRLLSLLLAAGACSCQCSRETNAVGPEPVLASASGSAPVSSAKPAGVDLAAPPTEGPRLAAKGIYVMIREKPGGAKIGYIRLGGMLERVTDEPVSKKGCEGGWYQVKPRGYACLDEDGTLDADHPVVRAASRRPDLSKPMPFAYGFVRSVLPLYLKVPSRAEQLEAEFKLEDHLQWWNNEGRKYNEEVTLGANDVFIDGLGVPDDQQHVRRLSTEMSQGELFGGKSGTDPIPWWIEGGRKIPNVARFKVPKFATFADRARRHFGLAFVGSFPTGPESLERRFAITEDLRLAPTTKVKPETGSPFHGVALGGDHVLPVAWVTERDARRYKLEGDKFRMYKKRAKRRDVLRMTGKKKWADSRLYYELSNGKWMRAKSLGIATAPEPMPKVAKSGGKWIDISIRQQTLVLWEGDKAVYATLVSTGQDMLGDPKTTKSTVTGTFRVQSKHVTKAMDSAEGLSKESGDPEYGISKRRGEGSYLLAHVPWIQYFKGNYALHGTYWHDVFGLARSHGCINLSPIDAHRVFFWTTPTVPRGWHGTYARGEKEGTPIFIHE